MLFTNFEVPMKSLQGRKLLSTYYKGFYKACTTILENDNLEMMGFMIEVILGGKYLCEKMDDWQTRTNEIGPWFSEMAVKFHVNDTRPSIEFYLSNKELFLYLPLK